MANQLPGLVWVSELLSKAVIRRASHLSAASLTAIANIEFARNSYIIRVLEAPAGIRDTVRTTAIVNAAADPSDATEGQKQLVCILSLFEVLPDDKKAAFIEAYKGCATVAGQGSAIVVHDQTWDPDHIPPYLDP